MQEENKLERSFVAKDNSFVSMFSNRFNIASIFICQYTKHNWPLIRMDNFNDEKIKERRTEEVLLFCQEKSRNSLT